MGNKFCKKKADGVDSAVGDKTPSQFDRIITRLHIRPSAWKSETHLNQKHINRSDIGAPRPIDEQNNIIKTRPLSKSSDWTEVDLEVPEKEEQVHLRNPRLSLIFNNDNGTPTPPPRKQKRNFREKIEAVAKSGLQAFQPRKPVEEVVCVKKIINYKCPLCDQDENAHNRDHHHHHNNEEKKTIKNENNKEDHANLLKNEKELSKRKKNLSVISLPNYDELKLTIANFDDIDKGPVSLKLVNDKRKISELSLLADPKKPTSGSTGKLDAYITRCRSFGSLLPQHFRRIRGARKAPAEIESDDSFGGLEDWDLGLLEHYNPKDASLPRPKKVERSSRDVLSDLESMIVHEEDVEKPVPPVRRSESLVKKIHRDAAHSAHKLSAEQLNGNIGVPTNRTPPPSPIQRKLSEQRLLRTSLPTEENGHVEHSSLLKILENFSIKDKLNNAEVKKSVGGSVRANISSNESSLTPSLVEFEKNVPLNSVEDFIIAEKINTERDPNTKLNHVIVT